MIAKLSHCVFIHLFYVAVTTASSTGYSSPASNIVGAPPTQQQQQQPSANSSSSTSHLFGHQSQGTAPFLSQQQQQQVAPLPSGNPSSYSQHQQPVSSYSQQQQPQSDASYQMPSAYGGQTGYSATSNVAQPSVASYPQQQQQQQYQATPTAGAAAYPQGYASGRYPSTATPPQPAAPVSSQGYPVYAANKNLSTYGQPYQPYQY